MTAGKEVSWIPSYGPEMRGGTANCTTIVADKPIGSPIVPNPDSVIAMNRPSMDKFGPKIRKDGVLIVNTSLVKKPIDRRDIDVVGVKANDEARKLGNEKAANMIAMGAYIAKTKVLPLDHVIKTLPVMLKGKEDLIEVNEKALRKGYELAGGD
jgi:2-oxoglutarate ferredoxin oxidoreductase subunit gamma